MLRPANPRHKMERLVAIRPRSGQGLFSLSNVVLFGARFSCCKNSFSICKRNCRVEAHRPVHGRPPKHLVSQLHHGIKVATSTVQ
jgi:hypothetical protein